MLIDGVGKRMVLILPRRPVVGAIDGFSFHGLFVEPIGKVGHAKLSAVRKDCAYEPTGRDGI
jgi:hypothetical protein